MSTITFKIILIISLLSLSFIQVKGGFELYQETKPKPSQDFTINYSEPSIQYSQKQQESNENIRSTQNPSIPSSQRLKKLIHIQRHGARTSESSGMLLTNRGQQQMRSLGLEIFTRYSPFLSNPISFFSNPQVYSAKYSRTIQSAEYFLQGLRDAMELIETSTSSYTSEKNSSSPMICLPFQNCFHRLSNHATKGGNTNQKATNTSMNHFDRLLNGWRASECALQAELIKSQINSDYLRNVFDLLQEKRSEIEKASNNKLNSFYDAYLLYDDIRSSENEETNPFQSNPLLFHTVKFMSEFSAMYSFYGSVQQQKVATKTLTQSIYSFLIDDNLSEKFAVFSGHDLTLDGLLAAFNLSSYQCIINKYLQYLSNDDNRNNTDDGQINSDKIISCVEAPDFAANMQIELYEDNSIRFTYQSSSDQESIIRFTHPSIKSLNDFKLFNSSFYRSTSPDINEICDIDKYQYKEESFTSIHL